MHSRDAYSSCFHARPISSARLTFLVGSQFPSGYATSSAEPFCCFRHGLWHPLHYIIWKFIVGKSQKAATSPVGCPMCARATNVIILHNKIRRTGPACCKVQNVSQNAKFKIPNLRSKIQIQNLHKKNCYITLENPKSKIQNQKFGPVWASLEDLLHSGPKSQIPNPNPTIRPKSLDCGFLIGKLPILDLDLGLAEWFSAGGLGSEARIPTWSALTFSYPTWGVRNWTPFFVIFQARDM